MLRAGTPKAFPPALGKVSENPNSGRWQWAQETSPFLDQAVSKNNDFPSSTHAAESKLASKGVFDAELQLISTQNRPSILR
jgi:hypothetical protein